MNSPTDTLVSPEPTPAIGSQETDRRIIISREGEQALRRELAELLEERDVNLPKRLESVRQFGSGSENDEYLQILEEEAVHTAKIEGIRQILSRARVVDPAASERGVIGIGTTVTLRVGDTTMKRTVRGAHEAIGGDGVSSASPIGSAILGRRAGEIVTAELPDGRRVEVDVVEVGSAATK